MIQRLFSWKILPAAVLLFLPVSCSYYRMNTTDVQNALLSGNVPAAYKEITHNEKKWLKGRNDLLYYWDRGTIARMAGKYDESIDYFKRSDYFMEDIYKNYANIALSLFVNDRVKDYTGEDHERILFHYYQIINFLSINNIEHAQVQSRRLRLELERLDDRYKDKKDKDKRRYQRDAFAYLLIGLVNEAANETNDAYIAYKLAYQVYKEDYKTFFGLDAPQQLKEDLLRLTSEMGFTADREFYEKEFGFRYDPNIHKKGNFVFFWNNGFAPIKREVSVNFTILKGTSPGWVIFFNNDFGFSIPVYVGEDKTQQGSAFSQIEFVRATFPQYMERGALYSQAKMAINNQNLTLQTVEDINALSFKVLEDRFFEEMGRTLLRLALKKVSEYELKKQNEAAGAALGIVNFITEQADTRCWSSLPYSISYSRTSLPQGTHKATFVTSNGSISTTDTFQYNITGNGMYFHAYRSLQAGKIIR